MEEGWERTPEEFKYVDDLWYKLLSDQFPRHLVQIQETMDGNFHLNQFAKNTDPNDVSLETANGIGYFPDDNEVKEYLENTEETQEVRGPEFGLILLLMF